MNTIKKNISLPRNEIFRSIPQMLNNHLPGGLRSFGNYYYLLRQVFKSETEESNDILNIIYNDLIYHLNKWATESLKYQEGTNANKKQVKISEIFSIHPSQDKKVNISLINEEFLKSLDGFKKEYLCGNIKKHDFVANQIALIDDNSEHKGEYFPYTFRCSSCNKIVYSETYPKKTCCSNSKWIQLSVFLVSSDGRIDSIGRPNDYSDYHELKCRQPGCKGSLQIKESNQAKNYKLICNTNPKHDNSHFLNKPGFMLYSIFSGTIFAVHTSEVINFDLSSLQNLNSDPFAISDNDFIDICESNINNLDEDTKEYFYEFKNNVNPERNKRTIIRFNLDLFSAKSNCNTHQSIHLDLNNPKINDFCHIELKKKTSKIINQFQIKDLIDFSEIGLVNDIEVINYSYGFSRVADKPIFTPSGQVKFNFFYEHELTNSSLYPTKDEHRKAKKQIFYSKEKNKGIYFKISSEKIASILNGIPIPTKGDYLSQSTIYEKEEFKIIFTYLHSLTHFFIKTISQHFSGINTSSLSEMIFPHEYAFVIYKTGTGKDLGYLESFFEEYILGDNLSFLNYLNDPTNLICPAFELCTNGACIECLYTNKHSCKYGNEMLNRDLII